YDALQPYGIFAGPDPLLETQWLNKNINQYDGIHIHWPEQSWRGSVPDWYSESMLSSFPGSWRFERYLSSSESIKKTRSFINALKFIKTSGRFIIWTFHNVEPHESTGKADRIGYNALASCADLVIAHDDYAASLFKDRYPRAVKPIVMPHGNYRGIYPEPQPRSRTLSELGLDDNNPVFACVGRLRRYKGFVDVVKAFNLLGEQFQLIVAGAPDDRETSDQLDMLSAESESIRIMKGYIDDQRFSDIVHASAGVILPYKSVTGSGALLAALSLDRGVIVSDLDYFKEIMKLEPDAGFILSDLEPRMIANSIQEFCRRDENARNKAVRRLINRFDWCDLIKPVAQQIAKINRLRSLTSVGCATQED
ncbi:MAG: glycosyltransferase, partial [Lamprobacter sp.]|uniref:glycosyltransferase family 4 protein n=1 Tax=Lamprobacter sp. TaxID=3100796 RepID=UPI002B25BAFB